MSDSTAARSRYQARLDAIAQIEHQLAQRNGIFVIARTILFFAAAILLCAGYLGAEPRTTLLVSGWTLAGAFLVAITAHEHQRLKGVAAARQKELYQRLLWRMDRKWDQLPVIASGVTERSALADDLDLFGSASLWQLLTLPSTGFGRCTLADWLLTVPKWPEVTERQAAVKDLQSASTERELILDTIATISDKTSDATDLAKWAAGPSWLPQHRIAHALSYIGPALILVGSVGLLLASLPSEPNHLVLGIAFGTLGTGMAINLVLTMGWGSWMHDIFLRVTGSNRDAQRLSEVFQAIGTLPGNSSIVTQLRSVASQGETSAVAGFRALMWRVILANLQRDPLFYLVYLALQLVLAWDFRVMKLLEQWQSQYGQHTHGWFTALGQCESLIAAATLADENPDWCYPSACSDKSAIFDIQKLGHPLLTTTQRVTNDVRLEKAQPLLLVTGSNMAGKSTLLRSLGLNQILARIGAPVCAASYQSPLFDLATSIRVRDSLKEGVSFFMAELKRLKEVVDTAQQAATSAGELPPVMFLLDEILQGTNSRERQIAVLKVIQRLLDSSAVGAISTHDLELADQAAIIDVSQIVHFREYFESGPDGQKMRFDYVMRPGPTPTTNALKLLSMVGLDVV